MASEGSRQSKSKNSDLRSRGIRTDDMTARERILEVAEELIAEHGPYGFRLQDVASRLKVKPPALYNHFRSKDDLLGQLATDLSQIALSGYYREPGEDRMASFRRGARRMVKHMYDHPAGARLMLWEIAQGDAQGWEESASIDAGQRERSRRAFQRAIDEGEFRDIRFEVYLSQLIGGLASLVLYPSFDESQELVAVETLQREADDLIVRILTPDKPLSRLVQQLWEDESESSD